MKQLLTLIGFVIIFALADQMPCQAGQVAPDAYKSLSDSNRRIVSAIYEAQLGSRRDLAGHPLMGKDEIAAMRRNMGWKDIHGWLAEHGYVATRTLSQAIGNYSRDILRATDTLIISTGAGEQRVMFLQRMNESRSAPPNPALANIIPVPITERAEITVVELPPVRGTTPDVAAAVPEMMVGGIVAASAAATTMPRSGP